MANRKFVAFIIMVMALSTAFPQTDWEIDKVQDDIIVYTRKKNGSDFRAFKAVIKVDAAIADILPVLQDADNYLHWYGYTKSSKVLASDSDAQYNYVETIFPWPYANRDMVYRMTIDSASPQEVMISLMGIADYLPEKKGIVRMKKAAGFILLKSVDGQTQITYQFHSEPGDAIPSWLANSSIADLPYKTLLGLRKQIYNLNKSSH